MALDNGVGTVLDRAVHEATRRAGRRRGLLVVGTTDGTDTAVAAAGPLPQPGLAAERVLFEIGSVTKVFTALLLAIAVQRGEANLDDPVADHLPEGAQVPHRDGAVITLKHLATHTSGLPRLPPGMWRRALRHRDDPYAELAPADVLSSLGSTRLRRASGRAFAYSNFGAGLLGLALARTAGVGYETLVRDRITAPLGMTDTVIALDEEQQGRFAPGTTRRGKPAAPWTIPGLAGAGALRSTVANLLVFASAQMGHLPPAAPAELADAIQTTQLVQAGTRSLTPGMSVALGWMVVPIGREGVRVLWHNGGTGGYRSFIGLTPATHHAAVALSSNRRSVDGIGRLMLSALVAPAQPPGRAAR